MRKCKGKYVKWNYEKKAHEVVAFDNGTFHQWGSNYEEYDNGAASFTVGIVELSDGTVIMPIARWIQFID